MSSGSVLDAASGAQRCIFRQGAKCRDGLIHVCNLAMALPVGFPQAEMRDDVPPSWRLARLDAACAANLRGADWAAQFGAYLAELGFGVAPCAYEARLIFGIGGALLSHAQNQFPAGLGGIFGLLRSGRLDQGPPYPSDLTADTAGPRGDLGRRAPNGHFCRRRVR